ncbi:hypothetical protein PX699_24525 [Sphingobium sp. H39-3-25]|uniref:hypothetical protein n=1 Tax=Sphingobium TaxID=165695 RepID=UPI0023BA344F|nr:hypothetical protein [Sphingobium arseniciresistens]
MTQLTLAIAPAMILAMLATGGHAQSVVSNKHDVRAPAARQPLALKVDEKQPSPQSTMRPPITLHLIEAPTSLSIPSEPGHRRKEGAIQLKSDRDWKPLLRYARGDSLFGGIGLPPGVHEPWPRGTPLDDTILPQCTEAKRWPCLMPEDYPDQARAAVAIGGAFWMTAFKLKPGRSAAIAFTGEDDRNDLTAIGVESVSCEGGAVTVAARVRYAAGHRDPATGDEMLHHRADAQVYHSLLAYTDDAASPVEVRIHLLPPEHRGLIEWTREIGHELRATQVQLQCR